MLEGQQAALVVEAERAVAAEPAGRDDAMARDEGREPVARAEGAGRAGGAGPARERGQLAVGDDLAARDGPQRALAIAVEAVVEVELDVGEVVRLAREERPATACGNSSPCNKLSLGFGVGSSDQTTRGPSSHSSPTPQPGASYRTSLGLTRML